MVKRKSEREVGSREVREFIRLRRIQSYVEVRLDATLENLHLLEQHLRFVMSSMSGEVTHFDAALYRPLFEEICLEHQARSKDPKWVERLHY